MNATARRRAKVDRHPYRLAVVAVAAMAWAVPAAAQQRVQSMGLGAPAAAQQSPLQASSGGAHQVIGNGLTLTVDTRWVEGAGYRPVRVEATPAVPSPQERTLSVEFSYDDMYYGYGGQRYMTVSQDIVIPEGSTGVSATILVPEHFITQQYHFEVFEDGRKLKKLSFDSPNTTGNWWSGMEEAVPSILMVGTGNWPDTSVMAAQFPAVAMIRGQYGGGPAVAQGQMPMLAAVPPAELPRNWLDYTNVDVMFVPRDQLEVLQAQRPEALAAIRRWTAAGGNLIVTGAGRDWGHLATIERLLDLPALEGAPGQGPLRGWTPPEKRLYGQPINDASGQGAYMTPAIAIAKDGTPLGLPTAPQQAGFASRKLALGTVVAIAAENPFPGAAQDWTWLFNHLGDERYLWFKRHGLSVKRENEDYWNWMIRGVGLAPVTTFRVLITLFVVGIGPVNYFWLRYKRKLHLLLVIVPACAVAVTGGLFAYAVLGDGLGVRARVRSYTEIDQRRGEAVCWSRISYYAGLTPLGGLTFAPDVAVYPLSQTGLNQQTNSSRSMAWTDQGQRLASGWLTARVVRQFMTVRSRATQSRLKISKTDQAQQEVENLLGTPVRLLLVVAPNGTAYRGADIEAGATARLTPADADAELKALKGEVNARRPFVAPGVRPDEYYELFGGRAYYGYYNSGNVEAPLQITGRLEGGIAAVLSLRPDALPPRTYVALVQHSPESDVGLESYREEQDSLHVVVGRW